MFARLAGAGLLLGIAFGAQARAEVSEAELAQMPSVSASTLRYTSTTDSTRPRSTTLPSWWSTPPGQRPLSGIVYGLGCTAKELWTGLARTGGKLGSTRRSSCR